MSFASRAIYGARPFTRIFINALSTLRCPSHRIRVSALLQQELSWWLQFSSRLNGLVRCSLGCQPAVVYATPDASFSGFGATMGEHSCAGTWITSFAPSHGNVDFFSIWLPPPLVAETLLQNINFLKLIFAYVAILVWAPLPNGRHLIIRSDNSATVAFINNSSSKNLLALRWLKLVFYSSCINNFRLSAEHCPGITNVIADLLSRLSTDPKHLYTISSYYAKLAMCRISDSAFYSYPTQFSGKTFEESEAELQRRYFDKN